MSHCHRPDKRQLTNAEKRGQEGSVGKEIRRNGGNRSRKGRERERVKYYDLF